MSIKNRTKKYISKSFDYNVHTARKFVLWENEQTPKVVENSIPHMKISLEFKFKQQLSSHVIHGLSYKNKPSWLHDYKRSWTILTFVSFQTVSVWLCSCPGWVNKSFSILNNIHVCKSVRKLKGLL